MFLIFGRIFAILPAFVLSFIAITAGITHSPHNVARAERLTQPSSNVPGKNRSQKNVATIVRNNCVGCHRKGGIAPFPLESFKDVIAHKAAIRASVQNNLMPPWQAAPAENGGPSPWQNDCSLSPSNKQTLLDWLNVPSEPADSFKDLPPLAKIKDGWTLGTPDAVYSMPKSVDIPASGVLQYRHIDIDVELTEDKWVKSYEIIPGNKTVVHHVQVYIRKANVQSMDDLDERSPFLAAYVPGTATAEWPAGLAKKLPKNSVLRFQIHYTTNGLATKDKTRIGLRFAKTPPVHEIKTTAISTTQFVIPAGAARHAVVSVLPVTTEIRMTAFELHMHLRGVAGSLTLIDPAGQRTLLLNVPRYDFNWQHTYRYKEPLSIVKGSQLELTCIYDNSKNNLNNPDPKKDVRWGQQTFQEMQLGYIEYHVTGEDDSLDIIDKAAHEDSVLDNILIFLDKNFDNRVTGDEVPALLFRLFDKDKDGNLGRDELKGLLKIMNFQSLNIGQGKVINTPAKPRP